MMSRGADLAVETGGFRATVRRLCDFDPGPLDSRTPLADAGLTGFGLLQLVDGLERELGIEFPPDLLTALETVDDLAHYTRLKIDQKESG
jgi:acyl carrier protein